MSNVLIGIIGVILFIGLALAGALFLGPRFQQSTNSSRGAAAVQAVSQIASATEMYNASTAQQLGASLPPSALVDIGYLKSVPSNPVSGGTVPKLIDITGKSTTSGGGTAAFTTMDLGPNGDGVCLAIQQQNGQATSAATTSVSYAGIPGVPNLVSGCVKLTAAVGDLPASYIVFATI